MVSMSEVIFVVAQKHLSLNQKDLGAFTFPCVIGNTSFIRAYVI